MLAKGENIFFQCSLLNLSVSEIEGDAILFYRMGESPTPEMITEQSKKMFFNFQNLFL